MSYLRFYHLAIHNLYLVTLYVEGRSLEDGPCGVPPCPLNLKAESETEKENESSCNSHLSYQRISASTPDLLSPNGMRSDIKR